MLQPATETARSSFWIHAAIHTHLSSRVPAWHLQPRVAFGAAFARPWFYATGPLTDPVVCDPLEERRGVLGGRVCETPSDPFGPESCIVYLATRSRAFGGTGERAVAGQPEDFAVVAHEAALAQIRSLA